MDENRKIDHGHLQREAYLYVRQSSIKQVMENQESTKRQYALRDRAVVLGWPIDKINIIDNDQGQSGAESINREGFQKLVSEVGMGKAGIVMGLEVSRLARNSTDWHRLLEICALTKTLILDEDGVYDPGYFNDRLLLGLKGTMSEAELHILRARLRGGVLNKARRGELKLGLPIGFIYDCIDKVVFDPDNQVQESIKLLFKIFENTGTAHGVVKYFLRNQLKFPRKPNRGINKDEIIWGALMHSQVLRILHNPRYAGIFFYGRTQVCITPNKKYQKKILDKNCWHVFLPNSHIGYISQEQYELNQKKLMENATAYMMKHRKSPPREGPALIQGLVICGTCGRRMTVRYYNRKDNHIPYYVCQKESVELGKKVCQTIPGKKIDEMIADLLLEKMTSINLEIAIAVQKEIEMQIKEIQNMHKKNIERAKYEADLARRRYMNVDPANRLVADSLELEWNRKLLSLKEIQEEYDSNFKKNNMGLTADQKNEIIEIAGNFPKLWKDQNISYKERKRMVRLIIEDVTLIKNKKIVIHVRFKGGANETRYLPLPLSYFMEKKTKPEIVRQVDEMLSTYTNKQIADYFNEKGVKTSMGDSYTTMTITRISMYYNLRTLKERLRDKGCVSRKEIQKEYDISYDAFKELLDDGLIDKQPYGEKNALLYEIPNKLQLTEKVEEIKDRKIITRYTSKPRTNIEIVNDIDEMLNNKCTFKQIAVILNKKGTRTAQGKKFTSEAIRRIIFVYGLKSIYKRLKEKGCLSGKEVQKKLNISYNILRVLVNHGIIIKRAYGDGPKHTLYELPENSMEIKERMKNKNLAEVKTIFSRNNNNFKEM